MGRIRLVLGTLVFAASAAVADGTSAAPNKKLAKAPAQWHGTILVKSVFDDRQGNSSVAHLTIRLGKRHSVSSVASEYDVTYSGDFVKRSTVGNDEVGCVYSVTETWKGTGTGTISFDNVGGVYSPMVKPSPAKPFDDRKARFVRMGSDGGGPKGTVTVTEGVPPQPCTGGGSTTTHPAAESNVLAGWRVVRFKAGSGTAVDNQGNWSSSVKWNLKWK